jgi:hypothetical protein
MMYKMLWRDSVDAMMETSHKWLGKQKLYGKDENVPSDWL